MTLDALIPLLRCPACRGALDYEPILQIDAEAGACGVLSCACSAYPVLDGVPVLRPGPLARRSIADARVIARGRTVADVVSLIRDGRALDALVNVLAAPVCPWPLNRFGPFRAASHIEPFYSAGLAFRRRRVRALLTRRDQLTAEDWMAALYWHSPDIYDPFNYFFFRFGTPRHFATLGLLAALPEAEGGRPILDLACGYGHFAHALTAQGRAVVGLDQNPHQTWLAQHYIAPGAAFVCGDAEGPLPFVAGAFSAAFCADAFFYFPDKAGCLAELERCTAGGPVLLAPVGNQLVGQPDGEEELTPQGYAALFEGWQWRVHTESDLVARYLDGRPADLSTSSDPADVEQTKWIYYAAARNDATAATFLRNHPPFDAWPHAVGDLAVNPLYEANGHRLILRFPSPWYRFEHAGMLDYAPETASRNDDPESLVRRAVLVGLPKQYARPRGRPRVQIANRLLSHVVDRVRSALGR